MATNEWQKAVAKEVLKKLAEQIKRDEGIDPLNHNLRRFNENAYSKVLYPILAKKGVCLREAKAYQWRAIKPLVESSFENKVTKMISKLPEQKELPIQQ